MAGGHGDVAGLIAGLPDGRRQDAESLTALMERVTGEPPLLWGSIVGFGRYRYRYESGRTGEAMLAGFAPRKGEFSIYLHGTYLPGREAERAALLEKLGKHRIGKACLYVRKLADIDVDVLENLVRLSASALEEAYERLPT